METGGGDQWATGGAAAGGGGGGRHAGPRSHHSLHSEVQKGEDGRPGGGETPGDPRADGRAQVITMEKFEFCIWFSSETCLIWWRELAAEWFLVSRDKYVRGAYRYIALPSPSVVWTETLTLGKNTTRVRAFIFHMCILCDKTFHVVS